jgi:predicted dehydrogenase
MPEDAYRRQLRHFCRVIDEQEQPLVSAEDARRSLQVTAAILRSAGTGQTVDPSEIRDAG